MARPFSSAGAAFQGGLLARWCTGQDRQRPARRSDCSICGGEVVWPCLRRAASSAAYSSLLYGGLSDRDDELGLVRHRHDGLHGCELGFVLTVFLSDVVRVFSTCRPLLPEVGSFLVL
jgi:hypothetical protein